MECYSLLHGFWPPLLCQVNLQPGAQGLLLQCWWTDFQSLILCLIVKKLLLRHLRPCVPVSRPCQPRVLRSQDPRHPRRDQAQADRTCQEWEIHPEGIPQYSKYHNIWTNKCQRNVHSCQESWSYFSASRVRQICKSISRNVKATFKFSRLHVFPSFPEKKLWTVVI